MQKNIHIGFIGLGKMGSGMALNLASYCQQQQYQLSVLDINVDSVQSLIASGAIDGQSAVNMASQCDVIFTSLPSALEINDIAYGAAGILANAHKNLVWFETSTNDLAQWQKIIAADSNGITFIDAPVTGGAEGAAAGTLTMLLGCEQATFQRYETMLSAFTNKALRMGDSGAGYATKLCQLHLNYLVAQGIGEALMLGAKSNIDLTRLWDVLQHSCASSYVVESYIPKVLDGSYDDSFTLGLASKDLRLISQLGQHLNVPLTLGDTVLQSYQQAVEQYGSDSAHLSIVKLIEDKTGTLLR